MPETRHFAKPVHIPLGCEHCGWELAAIGERSHGVGIEGLRDYIWVHAGTGDAACAAPRYARPFDPWEATRMVRMNTEAPDDPD